LQVVLIDFGQAVEVGHPLSQELLERDLNMVRLFFVKQGISTLPQTRALEFVLAPQLSQTPDLSDGEEEADGESEHHESREAPTEDAASQDKTKGWRRAILSGWDDDANLVQLQTLLYNETQDEK
jgi:serine/threonine-protein kinase RIO1